VSDPEQSCTSYDDCQSSGQWSIHGTGHPCGSKVDMNCLVFEVSDVTNGGQPLRGNRVRHFEFCKLTVH
jgi:hypothetical protein